MPLTALPPPRLQQDLTVLTPPTATDILPLESVRVRLKLGTDSATLTTLAEIVTEASGLVAGYLRFSPAYSPALLESVWGISGSNLYLSARPVVAVAEVLDSTGNALAVSNYGVDRTASSIHRSASWGTWGATIPVGHVSLISGSLEAADWRVYYSAGWWLETMAGSPPAGVPLLPIVVRRSFIAICRWLWWKETGAQDAGIAAMSQEGASVTYRAPRDEEKDRATGLPKSLVSGMQPLRRAT